MPPALATPAARKTVFKSSEAGQSPLIYPLLTLLAAAVFAWLASRLGMDTAGHWIVAAASLLSALAGLYLMLWQPSSHLEVDAANAVIHKVNGTRFKSGRRAIPFGTIEAVEVTQLPQGHGRPAYAPQLRLRAGDPVVISGPYRSRAEAQRVVDRMQAAMRGR